MPWPNREASADPFTIAVAGLRISIRCHHSPTQQQLRGHYAPWLSDAPARCAVSVTCGSVPASTRRPIPVAAACEIAFPAPLTGPAPAQAASPAGTTECVEPVASAAPVTDEALSMPEDFRIALFNGVWEGIRDFYWDPETNGLDWESIGDDYAPLVPLWNDSRLPNRPDGRDGKERSAREIDQANAIFRVAELGGQIVGSIFGTHEGRKGWINRLAVLPAFRKRGIAARLVAEVERRLTGQGLALVACLIEEWNTISMEVFERLGYVRHPDIFYFSKRKNPDV